jgi:hypothetical protein
LSDGLGWGRYGSIAILMLQFKIAEKEGLVYNRKEPTTTDESLDMIIKKNSYFWQVNRMSEQ